MKAIILIFCFVSVGYAQVDIVNNSGESIGSLSLRQGSTGVLLELKVKGLSPGKHGMHFHTVGDCSDHHKFMSAKGHIMPSGKPHGYLNFEGGPHEGNLPNLIVHSDGTSHVELFTEMVSLNGEGGKPALFDEDGSTIIIHTNEDDHKSQPIGGSGARVACGVIKK